MSRFTGPQYKGASKALKQIRREEADDRNASFQKRKAEEDKDLLSPTQEEALLLEIFGKPSEAVKKLRRVAK